MSLLSIEQLILLYHQVNHIQTEYDFHKLLIRLKWLITWWIHLVRNIFLKLLCEKSCLKQIMQNFKTILDVDNKNCPWNTPANDTPVSISVQVQSIISDRIGDHKNIRRCWIPRSGWTHVHNYSMSEKYHVLALSSSV